MMSDIFYYIGFIYIINKIYEIYCYYYPSVKNVKMPKDMTDLAAVSDTMTQSLQNVKKNIVSNILYVLMLTWIIVGILYAYESSYFLFILIVGFSPMLMPILLSLFNKKVMLDMIDKDDKEDKEQELMINRINTIKTFIQILVVILILLIHFQ